MTDQADERTRSTAHVAAYLRTVGLQDEAVVQWLDVDLSSDSAQAAAEVVEWESAFENTALAVEWHDTELSVREARAWCDAGFTPRDTTRIHWEVFLAALRNSGNSLEDRAWLESGLPASFIVTCLQLDVVNVEMARHLFEVANSGH